MNEAIIFWSAVIIISGFVELQSAQLTSIWFTLAGIVSLIFALFKITFEIQLIVFFVVSIGLLLATRPLVKKIMSNSIVKTNTDRLVSMIGVVTKTIEVNEIGEIRVNRESWRAISYENKPIEVGSRVIVNSITGNKLLVSSLQTDANIQII